MLSALQWVYHQSVFAPITRELFGVRMLITLFHRASATLYGIYAAWGAITSVLGIPTLVRVQGEWWQAAFSVLVFIASALAAFGATFFPRLARIEMYAASGFLGLVGFYVASLGATGVLHSDTGRMGIAVLTSSVLVIPAIRCYFIYKTLIQQARED